MVRKSQTFFQIEKLGLENHNEQTYKHFFITLLLMVSERDMTFGVLLWFWIHHYAFILDIKQAFLLIFLDSKCRYFLRFLWFRKIYNITVDNIKNVENAIYRLCWVIFGVCLLTWSKIQFLFIHIQFFNFNLITQFSC